MDQQTELDVSNQDLSAPIAWKRFLITACKFLFIFYISTFCIVTFITHHGKHWLIPGIMIILLYLLILGFSVKKMMREFPMAAILLAAPTIPFVMLALVISMILALQFINKLLKTLFS